MRRRRLPPSDGPPRSVSAQRWPTAFGSRGGELSRTGLALGDALLAQFAQLVTRWAVPLPWGAAGEAAAAVE